MFWNNVVLRGVVGKAYLYLSTQLEKPGASPKTDQSVAIPEIM